MSDLKPCPFCGGEARAELIDGLEHIHGWQVRCISLECRVVACTDWCADKSEAVTLWDRRHETTSAAYPETTSGVLRCTCGHTEAEHYLCGSPQGSRCLTGCGCRQYTWNKQRKDA